MATKKIPISFNDKDQSKIKELIALMDIANTYGDNPKAVKFGISLALSYIKFPEKVETGLEDDELDFYFSSKKRVEQRRRKLEKARILQIEAQKV